MSLRLERPQLQIGIRALEIGNFETDRYFRDSPLQQLTVESLISAILLPLGSPWAQYRWLPKLGVCGLEIANATDGKCMEFLMKS